MERQPDAEPSSSTVPAEQELRRINEEWVNALVRGDTALLNHLMAEDCIFTYTLDGDDKVQFIGDIKSGDLQVESLKRENVEIHIYGSTGVLMGFDTANWRYKGRTIQGLYRTIHVYAERDGRWQIVTIQASPILLK